MVAFVDEEGYIGQNRAEKDDDRREDGLAGGETCSLSTI